MTTGSIGRHDRLAIAWQLVRSRMMLPISGTSNVARLDEDVAAASIVLTSSELEALERSRPATIEFGSVVVFSVAFAISLICSPQRVVL